MVFQHLHGGHIRGVDVVGGQSVAALQQVHVLHVEFLDGLAIELDGSALRHLDAGHALQHVADDAVALLLIGSDEVVERVAALSDFVGLDRNLFQLDGFLASADVQPLGPVGHDARHVANGHSGCRHHHGVGLASELQLIVPL